MRRPRKHPQWNEESSLRAFHLWNHSFLLLSSRISPERKGKSSNVRQMATSMQQHHHAVNQVIWTATGNTTLNQPSFFKTLVRILNFSETCADPPHVDHAFFSDTKDSYPLGSEVTYRCSKCYSGGGAAVCLNTGEWSTVPPCTGWGTKFSFYYLSFEICVPMIEHQLTGLLCVCGSCFFSEVTCADPANIRDGNRNPAGGPFPCGSLVTYFCHSGFTLIGAAVLQCGPDSTFDKSPPKCSHYGLLNDTRMPYSLPA